ncbi:TMEM175 family protein [Leptobacterium sp. I13]|uniref:TMEM175 family protein n=1 Tax=Leptobacterium meishanense TaxID=3128904 RepID=UPI0030EE1FAA
MTKGRLEAFSDGVLAIVITIMVLEMKIPQGDEWATLLPLFPVFSSYVLSFIYLGIYWNNHHHLFQSIQKVNGNVLWANLNLLFWLSLIPFVTGWMGQNNFSTRTVILYGVVLFMASIAFNILSSVLINIHGKDSFLGKAYKKDIKGKISIGIYAVAIGLSFINKWIGFFLYIVVAIIWIIPDKRIEKVLD